MQKGSIASINISKKKGGKKHPVVEASLGSRGIKGDGHSGDWHRQVSLLSAESIRTINLQGIEAVPGDFAENITTSRLPLKKLQVGDIIKVGNDKASLEVTQIGKQCLHPCRIYYQLGSCIMPQEGVFCRVRKPGDIKVGDKLEIV